MAPFPYLNPTAFASEESPDPGVAASLNAADLPCDQIIDLVLTAYATRPALAERAYAIRTDPSTGETVRDYVPEYRAISYQTLRDRVRALAVTWRKAPLHTVRPGDFVGVVGFASIDYAILDLALAYSKAIPVPLSAHLSPKELDEILVNTAPVALAVSIAYLPTFVDLVARHPGIRSLIVFDFDTHISRDRAIFSDAAKTLRDAGCATPVVPLESLLCIENTEDFDFLPGDLQQPGDTALLIHTSGSTGTPKGACIPAKALANTWRTVSGPYPKIVVVLAPFHHMMGRDSMVSTLNAGGTACFTARPDLATLLDDIRLIRPTVLFLFPRICEWIYQHFQNTNRTTRDVALFLGGRVQSVIVASAPLAPKVRAFLEEGLGFPVHEGYSSTETASGGLAMDGVLNRNTITDYRLRDVPESGYFSTDKPYPRGELCVKTRYGITKYFKNAEATAALFDEEGFCCTGDIVEERGPDRIAIIDRRYNVIKLSQGEFVAVGKLSRLFVDACPLVRQLYLHGESRRSYLLAVVVPDRDALESMQRPPANEDELIALVRSDILRVARERGLRSFEIPRDLVIADEPFSQDNGLLSSLGKPLQHCLRARYQGALEALFEKHENQCRSETETLRDPGQNLGLEEKLLVLVSGTLGVRCEADAEALSFRELGGDSLAAVQLSIAIGKEFGVTIEGDQILGPRGTVREWAERIRSGSARSRRRPGRPDAIHAGDFRLDAFLPRESIANASGSPCAPHPPGTVLLTGASGFLGGRVCLAWLERLAMTGGRLVCLVRPSDRHSAAHRLEARFARLDGATADRYRGLAEDHLEVVEGDLGEPLMGLDKRLYERLARDVDAITHCAALVNHRLSYDHLYRPNVLGTAEVIRLALTHRRKAIDFVSTIGVIPIIRETSNSPGQDRILLDASYAIGYFASKWGGEQLLRSAHDQTGLPVRVVRPGLILPDRRLAGEVNPDDVLSRLILSILFTGLAPEAFRFGDGKETGFWVHGLPVDQLADIVVALGDWVPDGFHVLSLAHGSDAVLPLERLPAWMASAGFAIERIADYAEWLARVECALRGLPREQSAPSFLDVMDAYRSDDAPKESEPVGPEFLKFLAERGVGNPDEFFTEAYVHKYLADLSARFPFRKN